MKKVLNLYKKYEEIINYLIIGGFTTVVSLTIKYALLFTVLPAKDGFKMQLAIIISWIGAVLFAYITNRKFVFKSKNNQLLKEFISFILSRIVTLVMEMAIMWFFVTLLELNSNLNVIIFTMLSQIVVIIGNYLFSKLIVFRK